MKEHGDNGSTATRALLSSSSHISSSEKLLHDQELQQLVTSSIPSPPYGGLSLINASAALVFGADPLYSTHLFASLAASNPAARFQLPIPIPLALQPAPANHPVHQLHHHPQASLFHHLPTAAVPAFAALPGATLPNAAQLDILSSWVTEQASKTNDDRKITSTTNSTPISATNNNNSNNKTGGVNNKGKRNAQVSNKNNKNLATTKAGKKNGNPHETSHSIANLTKPNRKNSRATRSNHLHHEGIVSSSENEIAIKAEKFEKEADPFNINELVIKPFMGKLENESSIQKMEIERSQLPPLKGAKGTARADNNASPPVISNNNNMNGKSQGQVSPSSQQVAGRDKVFTCPTCNRCFGYKHVLQNHERTHTGEKPFECTICAKKFTRDHHLKTHMRLHTGEKPYQCSHCDRQFVQVANLRRHLRVHTGERPYSCDLCSSRFSDSNQLKAHMLIHKGEKPYQCQECGGQFRRRHHLAHHKCGGEEESARKTRMYHRHPPSSSSSSSPDTSPPQLLTPASGTGSDRSVTEGGRSTTTNGGGGGSAKRERKCRETRRIIRLEPANLTSPPTPLTFLPGTAVPEQDHPEDLSMNGSALRSRHYSGSSSSVTASSSPSPRSGLSLHHHHHQLILAPYCTSNTSSSSVEETPDLFSDEDLRAADSSTNGKNGSSSYDDISSPSHHE